MRGARTADGVRHDTRAFEAVLNNLVHVAQQQEKDRKLGEQYDEKKVELEADAKRRRSARCGHGRTSTRT